MESFFLIGGTKILGDPMWGQTDAENLLVGVVSLEKRKCRGCAFARQLPVLKAWRDVLLLVRKRKGFKCFG